MLSGGLELGFEVADPPVATLGLDVVDIIEVDDGEERFFDVWVWRFKERAFALRGEFAEEQGQAALTSISIHKL